jgi:large subunit ribosomal protein L4
MPCSASSRAPTSCTASSPGSSKTAAAPPADPRAFSDVARTGKKFGRQKGGGTARHGDRRAPIFIGGGKAHGARARLRASLNKKVRALGLKMALSSKAKDGLVVVDSLD